MKIISISGLDGSGKSTQISLLKKHLESQGKKVFYFHGIQFSLAQRIKDFRKKYCPICRLKGKCKTSAEEGASVTRANWLQIQLRKIFMLIDILRFKSITRKNDPDYVLSDRYFYDTALNIKYLSKKEHGLLAERFIPSPEIGIYLEVEPSAIMQRKRIPDQGIGYLQEKKELFERNLVKYNLKKIDGDRSPEEIFEDIRTIISA